MGGVVFLLDGLEESVVGAVLMEAEVLCLPFFIGFVLGLVGSSSFLHLCKHAWLSQQRYIRSSAYRYRIIVSNSFISHSLSRSIKVCPI